MTDQAISKAKELILQKEPMPLRQLITQLQNSFPDQKIDQSSIYHTLFELLPQGLQIISDNKPIQISSLQKILQQSQPHKSQTLLLQFQGNEDKPQADKSDELMLSQFYKKEENSILFNLYQVICENSQKEMMYSDICKKYNERFASSKKRTQSGQQVHAKLNTLDVAHYCKKLEKCGFVYSQSNQTSSEKKIGLSRKEKAKRHQALVTCKFSDLVQQPLSAYKQQAPLLSKRQRANSVVKSEFEKPESKEVKIEDVWTQTTKRQKLLFETFQASHLTMREGVMRVLENQMDPSSFKQDEVILIDSDNEQAQEEKEGFEVGKFTISDISNALGMNNEEKTMSRVLAELKKSHRQIESAAFRNGRVFQYKYFLKNQKLQQSTFEASAAQERRKRDIKVDAKSERLIEEIKTSHEVEDSSTAQLLRNPSQLLLELNEKSYQQILKLLQQKGRLLADSDKSEVIMQYFTSLIQDGKSSTSKRSLTVETINRYIFVLNKIIEKGNVSVVDIRNDIKYELEKNKAFEIDKKTLKRIIDLLKQEGLVKTADFLVTLSQADGGGYQNIVKTLVLDPDCDPSDEALSMNPTIANPTNRQSQQRTYSLRSRKTQVKYNEEDLLSDTGSGLQTSTPAQQKKEEDIIMTDEEEEEEQRSSLQVAYVEEAKVKYAALAQRIVPVLEAQQVSVAKKGFQKLLEYSVIPKDFDFKLLLTKKTNNDNLRPNFIDMVLGLPHCKAQLQKDGGKDLREDKAQENFNFDVALNSKTFENQMEQEMDAMAQETLASYTSQLSTPKESIDEQVKEKSAQVLRIAKKRLRQIKKKGKRLASNSVFETTGSLKSNINQVCKILNKSGTNTLQSLLKEFSAPSSLIFALYHLSANGFVKVELEEQENEESKIIVTGQPPIYSLIAALV